jgi:5-(carboxyamino)imidazole ribonucleotide synthase
MRIGIVGGGQLAKMTAQAAQRLGFTVTILDPTRDAPASGVSNRQIVGDFFDPKKLKELADVSDVTTFDLEHVDTNAMKTLAAKGTKVEPSPAILEVIQDKLEQKKFLSKAGIPTSPYKAIDLVEPEALKNFGFPLVQKLRRGGYDGKGVAILNDERDLSKALVGESFLEKKVDIQKELGVIVARSRNGNTKCFPVVEMVFDPKGNLLDYLLAPAQIDESVTARAQDLASKTVNALKGIGVFGVELFLSKNGEIVVNEIAPRPHNSGHYTIEACATSQFEQHVRAICDLPLGSTEQWYPAAMVNLIGSPDAKGPAVVEGLSAALSEEGVSVHIYGKHETRPLRKMGHVTVLNHDLQKAKEIALKIKSVLKFRAGVEK